METIAGIGLIAYGITNSHVMVRVPNERGRWLLTHRAVAEVACRCCGATAGEPCHNMRSGSARRYWTETHVVRRDDAAAAKRKGVPPAKHKIRVTAADLEAASADAPEGR